MKKTVLVFSFFIFCFYESQINEDKSSEDLSIIEKNNKYGFADKTGKEIIPLIYDADNLPDENSIIID